MMVPLDPADEEDMSVRECVQAEAALVLACGCTAGQEVMYNMWAGVHRDPELQKPVRDFRPSRGPVVFRAVDIWNLSVLARAAPPSRHPQYNDDGLDLASGGLHCTPVTMAMGTSR
jgi:hypothetical protein